MERRLRLIVVTGLGLVFGLSAAHAEIYRCADDKGKAVFQDKPCDAASQPLKIRPAVPSAPTTAPTRDYRLEGLLLDERQRAREREADKVQRGRQAFLDDCRSMREDMERETAWLQSISDAIREGARIKIQQIEKRLHEKGC